MSDTYTCVLATGNAGKLVELRALLSDCPVEIRAQSEFGVPNVPETGRTFVENAIIKARNAAHHTRLPAIADDSGVEVDALDGAPGIYSARFAGAGADDEANRDKLLAALTGLPPAERTARYRCVVVYLRHSADPTPLIAEGSWEGVIADVARGKNGFGYDPIFFLPDRRCMVAELDDSEKNQISHRAMALRSLVAKLTDLSPARNGWL